MPTEEFFFVFSVLRKMRKNDFGREKKSKTFNKVK